MSDSRYDTCATCRHYEAPIHEPPHGNGARCWEHSSGTGADCTGSQYPTEGSERQWIATCCGCTDTDFCPPPNFGCSLWEGK